MQREAVISLLVAPTPTKNFVKKMFLSVSTGATQSSLKSAKLFF